MSWVAPTHDDMETEDLVRENGEQLKNNKSTHTQGVGNEKASASVFEWRDEGCSRENGRNEWRC